MYHEQLSGVQEAIQFNRGTLWQHLEPSSGILRLGTLGKMLNCLQMSKAQSVIYECL